MRLLATVLTAALLLTAACGGDDDSAPEESATTLEPAADTPPAAGSERFECRLPTADGPVSIRLDLPEDWSTGTTYGAPGCTYDNASSSISLGRVDDGDDGRTAQQLYDDQLYAFVEDGEDFKGDDSVYDLELVEDEPVLGSTIGDRVSWRCFCDGSPVSIEVVQAAGIEVRWTSDPDRAAENRRVLEEALAGAGLVP